jgi:hypothetical protein
VAAIMGRLTYEAANPGADGEFEHWDHVNNKLNVPVGLIEALNVPKTSPV